MSRNDEWTVEMQPDGRLDVLHNRRPVQYDCDDLTEALRILHRNGATEYVLVEEDGYRTTHSVKLR